MWVQMKRLQWEASETPAAGALTMKNIKPKTLNSYIHLYNQYGANTTLSTTKHNTNGRTIHKRQFRRIQEEKPVVEFTEKNDVPNLLHNNHLSDGIRENSTRQTRQNSMDMGP